MLLQSRVTVVEPGFDLLITYHYSVSTDSRLSTLEPFRSVPTCVPLKYHIQSLADFTLSQ